MNPARNLAEIRNSFFTKPYNIRRLRLMKLNLGSLLLTFSLFSVSSLLGQDDPALPEGEGAADSNEQEAESPVGISVESVDLTQPQPVEAIISNSESDDVGSLAAELEPPPPPLPLIEMDAGGGMDFADEPAPIDEMSVDGAEETISVDFPQEDVRRIIRNVADLYGLNVVIPDLLQGQTSIKLSNVTWQQVFDVVLDPLGYTYIEEGNIIKIKNKADIQNEPPIISVFPIDYAVADQLRPAIAPLVDAAKGGRIQVDRRTNSLIITEQREKMSEIQVIIDRLDIATRQVMIESKFIEVRDGNNRNLGLDWSSLNAYELISISGLERGYDKNDTRTLSDGENSSQTSNQSTSRNVDGLQGDVTAQTETSSTNSSNSLTDALTFASTITRTTSAVLSAGDFSLVLNLLQGQTDSRVVTNPTLVTLDGEEAKIVIGQQYPIPSYTYNNDRGTFEVSGFEFRDVGVVLAVRPQVNNDGFIRLDISPELSSIGGSVSFGGAAQAIPVINTTSTRSSVSLKDGFTLAIGGLLESSKNDSANSVPFFSSIPLLGRLFETQSRAYTESNLIIFITAKTLNPDGTTYREIIDPRTLAKMGLLESDIPGYTIPEQQQQVLDEIDAIRNQVARESDLAEAQRRLELLQRAENSRLREALEEAAEEAAEDERRTSGRRATPFMRRR